MSQTTIDPGKLRYPGNELSFLRYLIGLMNTMFAALYQDTVIVFPVSLHATKTIYNVFYAKRGYTVTAIDYVSDIAQAITGTVVKAVGTATPAIGTTPMHTANTLSFNTTAHNTQNITLTSTTADLVLAATNRIGLVLNAALTSGSGTLVIRMTKS